MGFLDRLLGRAPRHHGQQQPPTYATSVPQHQQQVPPENAEDERAVARYRYLLRTAPPEALEAVHAEAFSRLTPDQRSQVLAELGRNLPPGERPSGDDPRSLARTATRAELRQPGYLEQTFSRSRFGGGTGGGMGMGGAILGSMMGTIAGVVVGSAIADALFDGYADSPEAAEANDTLATDGTDTGGADDTTSSDAADGGDVGASDAGGGDFGGGDFGGGFGGGDFGGGDFGGDFGGGDF